MTNFTYKGFTYELIVRSWRKGSAKYECLKWRAGDKKSWERISYKEYLQIEKQRLTKP